MAIALLSVGSCFNNTRARAALCGSSSPYRPSADPTEYTETVEIVPGDDGWLGYDEPVSDF